MSLAEFKGLDDKGQKKPKYGNKKTIANGVEFDSKKEARRYVDLCLWQKSGQIQKLEHQKPYALIVNGMDVGDYVSDFSYFKDGELVVEDVKSEATRKTPLYRLKKKLIKAIYSIDIQEV